MKLTTSNENKVCTLFIEGSIDAVTSNELEKCIEENVSGCEKMILDMEKVDYISSAGLRVVIGASRSMGKDNLILRNLADNVMEIFRLTQFSKVLNIE